MIIFQLEMEFLHFHCSGQPYVAMTMNQLWLLVDSAYYHLILYQSSSLARASSTWAEVQKHLVCIQRLVHFPITTIMFLFISTWFHAVTGHFWLQIYLFFCFYFSISSLFHSCWYWFAALLYQIMPVFTRCRLRLVDTTQSSYCASTLAHSFTNTSVDSILFSLYSQLQPSSLTSCTNNDEAIHHSQPVAHSIAAFSRALFSLLSLGAPLMSMTSPILPNPNMGIQIIHIQFGSHLPYA